MTTSQNDVQSVSGPGGMKSIMRETVLHTSLTFFSTLAIQVTTFAILATAALIMPTDAFARLSIIVASTMLAAAFFELGLNLTSTKMFGDTRDEGYFRLAFATRILCIPAGLLISLGTSFIVGWIDIGLGIALGAVLNIWNSIRSTDQARQDYRSFTRSSLAFALVRSLAGFTALLQTKDPIITATAIYLVPVIAMLLSTSARYLHKAFSGPRPPIRPLINYASHVYLNAVAFIAIPYVAQFLINARLDSVAVGTYGLVLAFTGPVGIVIYALYTVLLPKMLGDNNELEELLWSWRGLFALFVLWALLLMAGMVLAFVLHEVYASRFPAIVPAFLFYFLGTAFSSLIGLYSLSVHTQGVPHLNVIVTLARLFILILLLIGFAYSLLGAIWITLTVLIAGQIALIYLLWRRRQISTT